MVARVVYDFPPMIRIQWVVGFVGKAEGDVNNYNGKFAGGAGLRGSQYT